MNCDGCSHVSCYHSSTGRLHFQCFGIHVWKKSNWHMNHDDWTLAVDWLSAVSLCVSFVYRHAGEIKSLSWLEEYGGGGQGGGRGGLCLDCCTCSPNPDGWMYTYIRLPCVSLLWALFLHNKQLSCAKRGDLTSGSTGVHLWCHSSSAVLFHPLRCCKITPGACQKWSV